jgi:thiol:disulfide interchange protein DsbD
MKSMRVLSGLLLAASAILAPLHAQGTDAKVEHVHWTLTSDAAKAPPGSAIPLRLTATIDPGWHIYSMTTPKGGGQRLALSMSSTPALGSFTVYQPKPDRTLDPNFGVEVETFSGQAVFLTPVELGKQIATDDVNLTAELAKFQECNEGNCISRRNQKVTYTLAIDRAASAPAALAIPAGYVEVKPGAPVPELTSAQVTEVPAAKVSAAPAGQISEAPAGAPAESGGLAGFAATAFGLGLLSILTPCVFPMIPITVSFFLNERGGMKQAAVFSLGIIGLFCALGLGVTLAFGPSGVLQLGANRWVNAFIAAVFGIFAVSLLGAFEITLPSSLLTKLDRASRRGGYAGTMLMGLTFSLTSFACVGPFVGPLLVSTVQSASSAQPVVGMFSFATGLASPFFLLAAFPSYLKKLPRSGGWLARVKVVMGFVLLALMFKYLSNIDQVLQAHLLTRERFLAIWFVLFAMAGLYLLGLLHLEGVEPGEPLHIGRLLTGSAFLIFALSLVPGMFCGSLGELDAYVPPVTTCAAAGGQTVAQAGPAWIKNEYRQALDSARRDNKLVLVNFTGYSCTNCKWMDANIFRKPEIVTALHDIVPVELYTDGDDHASEENARLEQDRFSTISQPFYVLMDADQHVIGKSSFTRNPEEFLAFLKRRPGA